MDQDMFWKLAREGEGMDCSNRSSQASRFQQIKPIEWPMQGVPRIVAETTLWGEPFQSPGGRPIDWGACRFVVLD